MPPTRKYPAAVSQVKHTAEFAHDTQPGISWPHVAHDEPERRYGVTQVRHVLFVVLHVRQLGNAVVHSGHWVGD